MDKERIIQAPRGKKLITYMRGKIKLTSKVFTIFNTRGTISQSSQRKKVELKNSINNEDIIQI